MGALAGPYFGAFLADVVGVDCSVCVSVVLIGLNTGFLFVLAGSGRTMSSMICSILASASAVCSFRLEV